MCVWWPVTKMKYNWIAIIILKQPSSWPLGICSILSDSNRSVYSLLFVHKKHWSVPSPVIPVVLKGNLALPASSQKTILFVCWNQWRSDAHHKVTSVYRTQQFVPDSWGLQILKHVRILWEQLREWSLPISLHCVYTSMWWNISRNLNL